VKRETAAMAFRYIEMRREYESLRLLPCIGGEVVKEARQNLVDAREGLATAVSKESDEVGVQVMFLITGGDRR
jgi:hypothetical protein